MNSWEGINKFYQNNHRFNNDASYDFRSISLMDTRNYMGRYKTHFAYLSYTFSTPFVHLSYYKQYERSAKPLLYVPVIWTV
jgi:myosin-crossreactive antigen